MIRLYTLGSLDLRDASDRPVSAVLTQPKRVALLAYLALARGGSFHRRDTLLALLWPELDETRARAALSKALHHLRQALGDATIITRGQDEVGVDPAALESDYGDFVACLAIKDWTGALTLYRGDLLSGFHAGDAPEFSEWLDRVRKQARARAVQAALDAAQQAHSAGDSAQALALARRASELAPEDEPVARTLMTLLDGRGDRAGAMAAYDALAKRLHEMWEVEPSRDTVALANAIRTRAVDPLVRRPPPRHAAADVVAATPREVEPARPHARRLAAPVAVAAVLLGIAGVTTARTIRAGGYDGLPRVVVYPLENRSDARINAVGPMVADWIERALAGSGLVNVVDAAYAAAVSRWGESDIAVRGAYSQAFDTLIVEPRLVRLRTGTVVLTLPPIRGLVSDPTAMLPELRERAMGALASVTDERLASVVLPSTPPPTYSAYREFVDGLEYFQRARLDLAWDSFQRAHAADSTFAVPLVWMAYLARMRSLADLRYTVDRLHEHRDALPPVERAAAEFFFALRDGRFTDEQIDGDRVMNALRRAAELSPRSIWGYMRAWTAARTGYAGEAAAGYAMLRPEPEWLAAWAEYWTQTATAYHQIDHATELDLARRGLDRFPTNASLVNRERAALAALGRWRELRATRDSLPVGEAAATEFLEIGRELNAHGHRRAAGEAFAAGLARVPERDHRVTGNLLYQARRWAEARDVFAGLLTTSPRDPVIVGRLGCIAARLGDRDTALRYRDQLDSLAASEPQVRASAGMQRAMISAVLGDADDAHTQVQRWLPRPNYGVLTHNIDFEGVRELPAFRELVKPRG